MGIASGLSLAATGLSTGGYFLQGQTAAANARQQGQNQYLSAFYTAEQAQLAATAGDLKATETDTFLRQQKMSALANIDAVLAMTGTLDSSPTNWAVKNRVETMADQERTRTGWNIRMQSQADRNASMLYMLSGINAMNISNQNASVAGLSGLFGAAGDILGGNAQANSLRKALSGVSWG